MKIKDRIHMKLVNWVARIIFHRNVISLEILFHMSTRSGVG